MQVLKVLRHSKKELLFHIPFFIDFFTLMESIQVRGDTIDTYKIVTGIYDGDKESFFKLARGN